MLSFLFLLLKIDQPIEYFCYQFVAGFDYHMDERIYMLIILPFLISITLIRNLKLLAPFSQVANFAMFIGLGILMYYIYNEFKFIKEDQWVRPPMRYSLFIGTTLFALEAVGVVSFFLEINTIITCRMVYPKLHQ